MTKLSTSLTGLVFSIAVPFTPMTLPNKLPMLNSSLVVSSNRIEFTVKSNVLNIESIKIMQTNG